LIKNSQPFEKKFQKTVGGIFWLTLYVRGHIAGSWWWRCGIGSKASLWCQAAPMPAPLATSTAAHSIQGGGFDAQSSYDRCS